MTMSEKLQMLPQYSDPNVNNIGDKTMVTYIWLGGSGLDLRGKTKIVQGRVSKVEELPLWNYDGSSTGQATGNKSEIDLRPVRVCKDPFRGGHNLLALCETYNPDGTPAIGNFRHLAKKAFDEMADSETWFGIEQEYILFNVESSYRKWPIGFGVNGFNAPQGLYYCGVGSGYIYGRDAAECHLRACLNAGLDISGINAEVFPGQWEYQVGVCKGIDMCDQLWLSRYILGRVCEHFGFWADLAPKPCKGDWNGSGCHTNFSTKKSRDANGGYHELQNIAERLKGHHMESMQLYGTGNEQRMTGEHETAKFDEFTVGVGARGCSIRIGNDAVKNGCGYMEDRRPSSNIDPYLSVTSLADIACNDAKNLKALVEANKKFQSVKEFSFHE